MVESQQRSETRCTPIVYRGAKEIGAAIGVPYKAVPDLVENEGLPAFKLKHYRHWLVLHDDLMAWMLGQRDKFLRSE